MFLSIIIPVYNESGNLASLVDEINEALESYPDCEIIVVDDGSTDQTLAELAAIRRRHSNLRIVCHDSRCGQSTAILSGVRAARSQWIVTLDGDGQNPPAEIPRLLAARRGPNDPVLVAGIRRRRNDGVIRRISSQVANRIRRRLLQDNCPDTGCGLKLFHRDCFLSLPHFNHMHRFLPALVQRGGFDVLLVEVDHRPRRHGRSKYGVFDRLWVGIADIAGVMWLNRRTCDTESREVHVA